MSDQGSHLAGLPNDVLMIITSHVGAKDICNFFATCQRLSTLSKSYVPPIIQPNFEKVVMRDRADLVRLFVEKGVKYGQLSDKYEVYDPKSSLVDRRCEINEILLIESCKYGSVKIAKIVIDFCVGISFVSYDPVRYASYSKNTELFEMMLEWDKHQSDTDEFYDFCSDEVQEIIDCYFDEDNYDDYVGMRNDLAPEYNHHQDSESEWRINMNSYHNKSMFLKPLPGMRRD